VRAALRRFGAVDFHSFAGDNALAQHGRAVEVDCERLLSFGVEEDSPRGMEDGFHLGQVRVRLVVEHRLQVRATARERDAPQDRSVQVRREDDGLVLGGLALQVVEQTGRMDVVIDECPRGALRDGTDAGRLFPLVHLQELAVGDVERGGVPALQAKASYHDARFVRRPFGMEVLLPVVMEGAAARGEHLDAVPARGEPRTDLEDVLLGATEQVAAEPRDDECGSGQARRPRTA